MVVDGEAAFIIQSETHSSADITAVLGIEPSDSAERGDLVSSRTTKVRDFSVWILRESPKNDPDDRTGFGTMAVLLERLAGIGPKLDVLRTDCRIFFDWFGHSDSTQGGFVLPSELLAQIAELRCDLYGEVYLDSEAED